MNLEHEFTYFARIKAPLAVGAGPYGNRNFFEVIDGECEGKRLRGKLISGGGDWLLEGPDGFGRLDVRVQLVTHDGAALYLSCFGVVEMNQKLKQALASGGSTDYCDHYFRTAPRIETGDERYAWVNQTLFVAEGHLRPPLIVEYRVYRVT
jgi:hypothetical protein